MIQGNQTISTIASVVKSERLIAQLIQKSSTTDSINYPQDFITLVARESKTHFTVKHTLSLESSVPLTY